MATKAELEVENADLKARVAELEGGAELSALQARVAELEGEVTTLTADRDAANEAMGERDGQIATLNGELQEAAETLKMKEGEWTEERGALKEAIASRDADRTTMASKIDELEAREMSYDFSQLDDGALYVKTGDGKGLERVADDAWFGGLVQNNVRDHEGNELKHDEFYKLGVDGLAAYAVQEGQRAVPLDEVSKESIEYAAERKAKDDNSLFGRVDDLKAPY